MTHAMQSSFGIGETAPQGVLFPDSNTEATREPLVNVDRLRAEQARLKALAEGQIELSETEICPECRESREDDDRVSSGMKCCHCSY